LTRNEKYLVTVTTACYDKATENNKKLHTGLNHTDMFVYSYKVIHLSFNMTDENAGNY